MTNADTNLTLVLGGTGKTGRRVAERLTRLGRAVRIGSRQGDPPFHWHDESTWAAVLQGVGSAYIAYSPDLSFPGAADAVGAFATAAVSHGVGRLVLLSGRGEEAAHPAEQAVRDAGAEWTILRSSWFAQNFSEYFLLEAVLGGVIVLPAGEVAEPFIDVDDVADVAVAALTRDGHDGAVYELTGPTLLTFADVADELSRVTGRTVRYEAVTPEEYERAATAQGVPEEEVKPFVDLFTRVLDGHNAHVTGDVERVLGRPPGDFAAYARSTADAGVWAADATKEAAR